MQLFNKKKGKLGAFKLESLTSHIAEFAGCASKMYSLLMVTEGGEYDTSMKGKGVPKRVLKAKARHDMYRDMVRAPFSCYETSRAMRSQRQTNVVLELEKRMLTAYNDKVYQIAWDVSRPLGHWRNESRLCQILNRFTLRACFRKLRDSKL